MQTTELETFVATLELNMAGFGMQLGAKELADLAGYYALLMRWNQRLHLVARCSPAEFANRHILESLLLLGYLPQSARIADIGAGAGLPTLPCLIVRPDLNVVLVESSQKKAVFLREALNHAGLSNRATIIATPFEDIPTPDVDFVTSRALHRFIAKLPRLLKWSPQSATLLLFGGDDLRKALEETQQGYSKVLIPHSDRRFLLLVKKDRRPGSV